MSLLEAPRAVDYSAMFAASKQQATCVASNYETAGQVAFGGYETAGQVADSSSGVNCYA